ncbi:MAG TPA: NUDIX domain-containing protein [Candidatus Nanoarchaeia archaeon]|nr:NUDIX domain-containing protein [Candidatus Nanoarchaeia archaeon]
MIRRIDLTVGCYIINNDKVLLIHHNKLDLWLPVGGHINPNETPDMAIKREAKEEVNLDIELIGKSSIPLVGDAAKENLALPFHSNLHSVGDHDHYCLFYLAKAKNPQELRYNHELKGAEWFSKADLRQKKVLEDVKHIALEAFKLMKSEQIFHS